MRLIRHITILLLLTIFGCSDNTRIGDCELKTLDSDEIKDIFGPRLGFEFLTKDSLHHSLAIISLTEDSIGFVLIRQTGQNLLEYSGYAIKDSKNIDNKDNFLTQGQNYLLTIKISKDRQDAELIYFDNKKQEVDRVTPDEIVYRQENAH